MGCKGFHPSLQRLHPLPGQRTAPVCAGGGRLNLAGARPTDRGRTCKSLVAAYCPEATELVTLFHAAEMAAEPAPMTIARQLAESNETPAAVDAATVAMKAWTAVLAARTPMSWMRGEMVISAWLLPSEISCSTSLHAGGGRSPVLVSDLT